MLNTIIKFSIQNKVFIAFMTLLWIIWGIWSATKLPIDAVPDITNNQVQIYTHCPTLATQEVEQMVTFPIEQSIANVPDILEVRSISRFGLSVITVVFKDEVDIYFARQLLLERLQEAKDDIPSEIGRPELAPVSTGLGEVFQYLLHPKPGSEGKYDAKELRTLQDWVVARQLAGTPGIAEVNSFGGELKQYEVAINPDRIRAMGVSIPDIFQALESNNENTGGAYIDKRPNAYFIRSVGIVKSIEDIMQIPVKTVNGLPLLIKDVAEVRYGAAIRYGALTYNGEVDAVGGVVMMLKGQNSHEVVQRIKAKLPQIQKSLPDDVIIEAYLDRTDLVGRAIQTVEKNLIEGALIVIFVLVLFLGNLRAGLIVASAIPLSLLFALGMMRIFGISANLMSLGAIDFGLIVDGAVIVVEATLHHLGVRQLTQKEMDEEVYKASSKIRKSAAFGEVIILLVYLPILTLTGIEGKMFAPMAKTVAFAILGALILSMTYIPMMCAWFLPKNPKAQQSISDRMMTKLRNLYEPLLHRTLTWRKGVISIAVLLFIGSILLFQRLGGEFIPQLREGDYAFHCILPPGSSLEQSIETSMQASRLLKEMKEVKMVIGKTGSAEVPTDPMPPEATDLMVILHPNLEKSYEQVGNEMQERLEQIPGVYFEKNQPIQMRFNELMTGIRQDVAVKIFGENLDTLRNLGEQAKALISTIPGSKNPQLERTEGLPQIQILYDRARMAAYGISIKEVNQMVSTAFAGKTAGVVFENERRFDLVVRLDSAHRKDLEDVQNLLIPIPSGGQIPLNQVAEVAYKSGPAQVSREMGKRRIVIGFNVDGRDVKSVVNEIQEVLNEKMVLPPGYYFTYGGQFENLERASARLGLVVPLALGIILLLLFFTFRSWALSIIIFSAIPLSAMGGVAALALRGMPFSISAGIGFIALFGVAVLNGIVLLSTYQQLEKEGITNPYERVIKGSLERLRPILMTATVASLGFLPMALSTGAGAEVQKPLATVVIGGLVSATALSLLLLPCLYLLRIKAKPRLTIVLSLLLPASLFAQERKTEKEVLDLAIERNAQVYLLKKEKASLLSASGKEWNKTGFFVENEDLRPSDRLGIWKIGISQNIAWPSYYKARKSYLETLEKTEDLKFQLWKRELGTEVRTVYYTLWYLQDKYKLYQRLDSLYQNTSKATELRERQGESGRLESISAQARAREISTFKDQLILQMKEAQEQLKVYIQSIILPPDLPLDSIPMYISFSDAHPELEISAQEIKITEAFVQQEVEARKPEFSGRIFSQTLWGAKDPFSGFSISTQIPIGKGSKKRIEAEKMEIAIQQQNYQLKERRFIGEMQQAKTEMEKAFLVVQNLRNIGLEEAEFLERTALNQYKAGDISYATLTQYLAQATSIRLNYLENLHLYNLAVIRYQYYL
ncbi:heavy metal efflux pump, CzcA family [Leadbetterella byssophila DSM 17132]|uniref:Heavy metal efflux pump, CzcA family n=1 Tax=Leadbetterella byssophila (strain DSM 17132 / JCM 16389 / KACC 11308 / NBRC 106382 / 4M15) TaxID=649349 RepID=E4RZV6_LEAB4|nr:CusA/CzcA family heavy metal efflux RND transporter [Leadbetterella byssophila]ADQ19248.1 heavy metal efflux pump, CzcA family [Leadbetterella byssophila DSM 17132]